jgi:hypothetical protein
MKEQELKNLRERTYAKLRYAKVHLDELKVIPNIGGQDFDKAHQESFLSATTPKFSIFQINSELNQPL